MVCCMASMLGAAEYHVAKTGCDGADGSAARPWRTIQRAADVAEAGDVVTIHGGTYREWVKPAHAGRAGAPIVYQAAKGEAVTVTGANEVRGWCKRPDGLWTAKVRYDSFGGLNPFTDFIFGNWFADGGKRRFRTRLLQNGKQLKLHGDEVFTAAKEASGKFLLNVAGITSGTRTIAGATAIRRVGPRDGFQTKWGLELGWITEGATCVYPGFDFTKPEARKLAIHVSSIFASMIDIYDAAHPENLLASVRVPLTNGFTTYATAEVTLPASASSVKDLKFRFRYAVDDKPLVKKGEAVLIPGMVAGTIVAAFEQDPNVCVPELVVRPACFYPLTEYRDYQTLRGIRFVNAGPNWAPPTSEQVGIVGTNWSRGWTIEDCEVSGSSCTGITLGKYGDEYDNFSADSQRYSSTIARAAENGLARVGYHAVRRCKVFDCGQAGICGSLGAMFSSIEDCEIYDCHWKKPFGGAEMAGIKIHGAVDFTIARCRIHHCGWLGGIWFDWMAQGARIVDNVLWANEGYDFFAEVDHGPVLVEGNDFLSKNAFMSYSQSIAFVGNRLLGGYENHDDARRTPIFEPHTATLHALDSDACTDGAHVFINNIMGEIPSLKKSSLPSRLEDNWVIARANWKVDEKTGACTITPPAGSKQPIFKPVTGARLGTSWVIKQPFPEPTVTKYPTCNAK